MACTRRQTDRYGRFLRYPVEIYPSRILTLAMPFCASTNRHCTCLFGPSGQKGRMGKNRSEKAIIFPIFN